MAVGVRSIASASVTSGFSASTLAVNKPAGTVQGDVLVAIAWQDSDGNAANLTPPAGWTQAGATITVSNFSGYGKVWTKVAGASEPASYTWNIATGAVTLVAILALTGVNQTTPVRVDPVAGTGTGTALSAPTIGSGATPQVGDLLICSFSSQISGGVSFSTPSGMTEQLDGPAGSPWLSASICTQVLAAAGATGAKASTGSASASGNWRSWSLAINGTTFTPQDLTDSGVGSEVVTVDKTLVANLTDHGTVTDTATVFHDSAPLTDSGVASETIAIEQLVDTALTDSAVATDNVEVVLFVGNDLTDSGTVTDNLTVDRTTFVPLTDSGVATDVASLRQDKALTDQGTASEVVTRQGLVALTDGGVATEFVHVLDIPFTQVLPLKLGPVYDLVVVGRIPQVSGPPVFLEIDPIEWKDLSYVNALSTPQELQASCLISSVTEPVLQRLRALHQMATELWLYRNGKVVFAGPLQAWRTSGESLTLSARGLLAYLRLMVVSADLRFDQVDQFSFVKTMVDQWQGLEYGNFGIDTSTVALSGQLRDGTYLRNELHNIGQRVEELGKRANGFDVEVDPATRNLQLWFPQKGVDRSEGENAIVVDSRNITSGDVLCSVAIGDLASEGFGTGTSSGGGAPLWSEQSNTDVRAWFGRSAVTGTWSDVSEQTTLDDHTRGLLNARNTALIVPGPGVRVTPDADLGSYAVGDTIAYDLQAQLGVTGAFRIRKQSVKVSAKGQESVDIEFV